MKTIEDAVIELGGKLPNPTYRKTSNAGGWYISATGKLTHAVDCVWFEPEQFKAEAKRLGYINGYKYMNEYTEKGKPNLTDDAMVSVMTYGRGRLPAGHVGFWNWDSSEIKSFRIVDERYKPADTRYLNAPAQIQDQSLTYGDLHERGELPTVGTKCLCWFDDGRECWHECFVIGSIDSEIKNGYLAVSLVGEHERKLVWANEFRPIKSHREKVIEAAMNVAEKDCPECGIKILGALYNAGMLVLPPKKSDTKD